MHVLGAENRSEIKSIRDQFVGLIANYELSRCHMVRKKLQLTFS